MIAIREVAAVAGESPGGISLPGVHLGRAVGSKIV
jgi:hypothetical protein